MRTKRLAMNGCVWRAGSAAIAILICTLSAGAASAGDMARFAQNASDVDRAPVAPSQPPAADAPAAGPVNLPEQIRKAQIELRRLDCFQGRADGKLGDQTRQAIKKFLSSDRQPAVEVNVTDALISDLAERGDNFCRPPRRFFAIGGRLPPFLARNVRPRPEPATAPPPSSPAAAQ